jgi:hypothetical protein
MRLSNPKAVSAREWAAKPEPTAITASMIIQTIVSS